MVVDCDGHQVGLLTGGVVDTDLPESAALVAAQAFHAVGTMAGIGGFRAATLDGAVARLLLVALEVPGFVLVAAAPRSANHRRVRQAALRCARHVARLLRDGPDDADRPRSLLHVADDVTAGVRGALAVLLREMGCSASQLRAESMRLRQQALLLAACRGTRELGALSYLAAVCRAAQCARPLHALGSGSWGTAFLLENGAVLKLTRDADEARASACLAGTELARLPRIRRVFQLTSGERRLPVFGIVREQVTSAGALQGLDGESAALACDILIEAQACLWPLAVQRCCLRRKRAISPRAWERAISFAWELRRELEQLRIQVGDLRPANMGLRAGELCFFDLSLAQAPSASMQVVDAPPVLKEHGAADPWVLPEPATALELTTGPEGSA